MEFLPANNARKVEKRGPKRWVVLLTALAGVCALSLAAGLLVWHLQCEWAGAAGPPLSVDRRRGPRGGREGENAGCRGRGLGTVPTPPCSEWGVVAVAWDGPSRPQPHLSTQPSWPHSPRVAEDGWWTVGGHVGAVSLALTTLLPLSLIDQNMRVQKVFNGYLRITNENFLDAYENPNSTEFANLANKVKEAVSPVPGRGTLSHLPGQHQPRWGRRDTPLSAPRSLGWRVTWASRRSLGRGPGRVGWALAWGQGCCLSLAYCEPPLLPQLKVLYSRVPALGPYHTESAVTAFRCVLGRWLGGQRAGSGITVVLCVGLSATACGLPELCGPGWESPAPSLALFSTSSVSVAVPVELALG